MNNFIIKPNEAKALIDSLAMDRTINYLQNVEDWTYDEAFDGSEQYKNYLFLLIKHNKQFPPTYQIQKTWKAHLLSSFDDYINIKKQLLNSNIFDFKNYFEDGNLIDEQTKNEYESITKTYFLNEFGESLPNFNYVNLRRKNKVVVKNIILSILFYLVFLVFLIFATIFLILSVLHYGD